MNTSKAVVSFRPIDAIELTIFSDLLSRLSRFHSLAGFAYGGMSGFALDDLKKMSREFGLTRMLAFDDNKDIVSRQRFNKPTKSCRVRLDNFDDFTSSWPDSFAEEGIEDASGYILWVRRDAFEAIGQGVRGFQQLVSALPDYGIARISLFVDFDCWTGPKFDKDGTRLKVEALEKAVSAQLIEHVGEFLEVGGVGPRTDLDTLCRALALAYGNAAGSVVGSVTGRTFEPLSVVRYGRGPVEITLTGMVVPVARTDELRNCVDEGDWPFASSRWDDVHHVRLPDVTLKERLVIEAAEGDADVARHQLGFDLDVSSGEPGLFDSFSRHHRYLPTLVPAEI